MAQRFYAARTASETQKLSMLWIVLFSFRWPMVLGFAIMGISIGAGQEDVEALLPQVLQSGFFPPGMAGLVVAAIFAASMSTFDSTINAGASYVVKDLVQPLRPQWGEKALVWSGYVASALIVAIGLTLSLLAGESVLGVWVKIVIQLFPAFLTPFALRWFWSRFNGVGFITGVGFGFAAAFGLEFVPAADTLNEVGILSTVTLISLTGCLLGTCLGKPVPEETLKTFYDRIRPFGLWPKAWKQADRAEHRADAWRLLAAVLWQLSAFLLPMLAVLQLWSSFVPLAVLWLILTVGLWRNVQAHARREAADAEAAA
jgi:Na+/proline symporter